MAFGKFLLHQCIALQSLKWMEPSSIDRELLTAGWYHTTLSALGITQATIFVCLHVPFYAQCPTHTLLCSPNYTALSVCIFLPVWQLEKQNPERVGISIVHDWTGMWTQDCWIPNSTVLQPFNFPSSPDFRSLHLKQAHVFGESWGCVLAQFGWVLLQAFTLPCL